jgi:hypothetical protein
VTNALKQFGARMVTDHGTASDELPRGRQEESVEAHLNLHGNCSTGRVENT